MRKIKILGSLAMIFLTSNLLFSCGEDKNKENEIKIGVTLYNADDTFISSIAKNIEEIAKEKEKNDEKEITVNLVDAKGGVVNQNNQVEDFIEKRYDVICVNLVDRTAASMIIDKAKQADIPLIFFNREPVLEDMQRWDKLFYVGAKAEQSGRLQGKLIVDEYNKFPDKVDKNGDGKIQYVMLEGEAGHQDTSLRTEYSIRTVVESGIEVEKLDDDVANWQTDEAIAKMTQWIKSFGDNIEVVFSNNDDMALGAIHALNQEESIKIKPLVVGIDGVKEALDAVKTGEMLGTIISDAEAQAKAIFDIADALIDNRDVMILKGMNNDRSIKTPHHSVNKENVSKYIMR